MNQTTLTTVLCTTGARASFENALFCLRRSFAAAGAGTCQIIVVHNAKHSSPELRQVCAEAHAQYLLEPVRGLSVARNTGVLACRSELVAFIDDDILVSEGWAGAILDGFRDPKVQAVTGPVVASREADSAGVEWANIYRTPFTTPISVDAASDIAFFPLTVGLCGSGGNMAFRTKFLLTNGLFDPLFGLGSHLSGGEEMDRFYAVVRSGGKIHFNPDAHVEHVYAEDAHDLRRKMRGYAAAQAGLLVKWFLADPAMRILILRYVASRATAVVRRGASDAPAGRKAPPRWPIILGTIAGPFRYFWASAREALFPAKTVVSVRSGAIRAKNPRVLMLTYNSGLGGAETICRTLAATLRSRWEVLVVVPEAGQMTASLRENGIPVLVVPRRRLRLRLNPLPLLSYLARFAGTVAGYRRVISDVAPDIVHVDSLLNLPALVAARRSGRKVLFHLQEIPSGFFRKTLALVAAESSDQSVAVSQAAAAPLRHRISANRLAVVHNGTGVEKMLADYDPSGWISFIARISAEKDPLMFVRAAQRVFREERRAKFLICGVTVPGRRNYDAKLAAAIAATGIPAENFRVLRDWQGVDDVLRQSAAVVNCPIGPEPFGLAILEAMAAGRPIVAPASGAFPEFIESGRTGLLYAPGELDGLVAGILRLIRDPDLAQSIGVAARATVLDRFRADQMADAMEAQYRICINQSRRRSVPD